MHKLFLPNTPEQLDALVQSDASTPLIVYYPPVGSLIDTDGGRAAERIAIYQGKPVLGIDPPTGNIFHREKPINPSDHAGLVLKSSKGPILESLDMLSDKDIATCSIFPTGLSEGGLAALALASKLNTTLLLPSPHIKVSGVHAAEPTGMYYTDKYAEIRRKYNGIEERMIGNPWIKVIYPEPSDSKGWEKLRRLAAIGLTNDTRAYKKLRESQIAVEYIVELGTHKDVFVALDFAETSLVLPPDDLARRALLTLLQDKFIKNKDHITSGTVAMTTNRSFSNIEFFNKRLLQATQQAASLNQNHRPS